MTEGKIIIPLNKPRLAAITAGAVGFVAIGFFLFSYNSILMRVIAGVSILFFGMGGVAALLKLFDPKPALVIDDEGITDNASAMSAGFIRWEQIQDAFVNEVRGQTFLTVVVRNPEQVYANRSGFQGFWMKLNRRYFKSPVQIPTITLKNCDLWEIAKIIRKKIKEDA